MDDGFADLKERAWCDGMEILHGDGNDSSFLSPIKCQLDFLLYTLINDLPQFIKAINISAAEC